MDDSGVNLLFPTFRLYCPSVFVCRAEAATCWSPLPRRFCVDLRLDWSKLVLGIFLSLPRAGTRNGRPDCLLQSITTCIDSRRFFYSSRVTRKWKPRIDLLLHGFQLSRRSMTQERFGHKSRAVMDLCFLFEAPTFSFIYLELPSFRLAFIA